MKIGVYRVPEWLVESPYYDEPDNMAALRQLALSLDSKGLNGLTKSCMAASAELRRMRRQLKRLENQMRNVQKVLLVARLGELVPYDNQYLIQPNEPQVGFDMKDGGK